MGQLPGPYELSPDYIKNPDLLQAALDDERRDRVRTGQPTKLTPARFVAIVNMVTNGASVTRAGQMCGVSRATISSWMEKGRRQDRGKFRDFREQVDEAKSASVVQALNILAQAVNGSEISKVQLSATKFTLERKAADEWGRQDRVRVVGKVEHDHAHRIAVERRQLFAGVMADPVAARAATILVAKLAGTRPIDVDAVGGGVDAERGRVGTGAASAIPESASDKTGE